MEQLTLASPMDRLQVPVRLSPAIKRVVTIFIHPAWYGDDKIANQYWRGFHQTGCLAVLQDLTERAFQQILPPHLPTETYIYEDSVIGHAFALKRLERRFPEEGTKLIVGFAGVQTAQFNRACDLITRWQARGATCVIGGPHITASITSALDGIKDRKRPVPCPKVMPAEIQRLMDRGVIIFHGEAEAIWKQTLADIITDCHQRLYRGGQPAIPDLPLPAFPEYYRRGFITDSEAIDDHRGCPWDCTYCATIAVFGRTVRHRQAYRIVNHASARCEQHGKVAMFFVGDNFVRNDDAPAILEGLAALRQLKQLRISFMIETDVLTVNTPGFIKALGAAGCTSVFIGFESTNPENLKAVHKSQNRLKVFEDFVSQCHEQQIAVHVALMIGLPYDTEESVRAEVEELITLDADIVSCFMVGLLVGSEDEANSSAKGYIHADFDHVDSFHPTFAHPQMTHDEWSRVYEWAWHRLYLPERMIKSLKRFHQSEARHHLLGHFMWCWWVTRAERDPETNRGSHPMAAGLYRFRNYWEQRTDVKRIPFLRFLMQEAKRHLRYIGCLIGWFYVFQHVIFEVEFAPALVQKRLAMGDRIHTVRDWAWLTFGKAVSRRWLHAFWRDYASNRWHLFWRFDWHVKMLPYAFSEVIYTLRHAAWIPKLMRTSSARG